jgi:thiosulfate/3-mercaptopyruvate sulfurtransferase
VTGDELARRIEEGTVAVIDVRSAAEYAGESGYPCDPTQGHIRGAIHLDWEALFAGEGRPHDPEVIVGLLRERNVDLEIELVTYCHSGQRSAMACQALRQSGLRAENFEGSWHEWSRRS